LPIELITVSTSAKSKLIKPGLTIRSVINNPLIDDYSLKGAKGLLINITGGKDLTLFEVDEAVNKVRAEVDPKLWLQ
jgi:cell division GTPase FtsZ